MRWGRPSVVQPSTVRSAVWRRWGLAAFAAIGLAASGSRLSAQANSGTVTGTVKDAVSGTPLAGAAVRVGTSQLGTQTGDDGKYTIRGVPVGAVQLQINRIGYEAKKVPATITAGGTTTVDVSLSQAAFSLSEVVVTVTGAQKKAEISNTVASVDVASKAEETTANNLGQLLSGQAAGVQIVSAGAAGGGSRIRIRGQSSLSLSNAPVVYVDGIKVSSAATDGSSTNASRFDDLNPDEIESIDVLKGPAAATLYGTEAANGVINITTKKGRAGATRWNVFGESGSSWDPSKGHYRDLWVSFQHNTDGSLRQCFLTQQANGQCTIDSTYHGNVLNQPGLTPLVNGNVNKVGLQVSGGSDRNQYFVSGEYNKEMGPYKMPQAEINRLQSERGQAVPYTQIYPSANALTNLRANLSTQLGSKADFNVSMGYIQRAYRKPANEDNSTGLMVDALGGPGRTDLAQPRGADTIPLNGYRSYPMGDIFAQEYGSNVNRFVNSINARYYPFSWLNVRANLGADWAMDDTKQGTQFNQGPYGETSRDGDITDRRTETGQYTVDLGATGTVGFWNQFNSKTSVGTQYYRTYSDFVEGRGRILPPGAKQVSAGATQTTSEGTSTTITFGQYIEQVLSYADRVFITGGLRYDGNSSFGRSFKGVLYPKIGASWLMSDESFFPKTDLVSSFRLRATYGTSGVQPGTTDAIRYFSATTGTINGVDAPGVQLGSLGNANLKPEYSGEFETGFDVSLFSSKTTAEFTYYNKKTKDALINRPLAPSLAGIQNLFDNLGSIRNQGMELTLNNRLIDNNEYGLDIQITGSTNKNRILALGEGVTPVSTGNRQTQYNAPGYPLYGMWGKVVTWNDANNDGLLAVNEVCQTANGCSAGDTAVYFGPSYPTKEFAVNPRFELLKRKLAISAQFDHKQGMLKFNNTLRHQSQGGQSAQGYWDPNASLRQQACTIAVNNYSTYSCMFENGRFTRLREVAVSYQMPDRLASRIHASRATLVAAGRNLHVWTPYSGVDPEATVGNGDQRGNEEYFSTPPLRYFTVRLNLTF
jgi:TonB-linked SusC/RagA family outer membrane protein